MEFYHCPYPETRLLCKCWYIFYTFWEENGDLIACLGFMGVPLFVGLG